MSMVMEVCIGNAAEMMKLALNSFFLFEDPEKTETNERHESHKHGEEINIFLSRQEDVHPIYSANKGQYSGNSRENSEDTNHRVSFDIHE